MKKGSWQQGTVVSILLLALFAIPALADFTPVGDIDMRSRSSMVNAVDVNATRFCTGTNCATNLSNLGSDGFWTLSSSLWLWNNSDTLDWNATKGNSTYLNADGDTATGNYTFDTNTFFIDSSDDHVGIGTTSPQSKLHIIRTENANTPHNFADFSIENDGDTGVGLLSANNQQGYIMFGDDDDSYIGGIEYDHTTDGLSFQTNNVADRFLVGSDGRVGLSVLSSYAFFNVEDIGSGIGPNIRANLDHTVTVGAINAYTRFPLWLRNNDVTSGTFTGIAFDVSTEEDLDSIGAAIYAERDSAAGSSPDLHDTNLMFATNDAGDDGNTVRMTITHDGLVGIGTQSPIAKLDVNGALNATTVNTGQGAYEVYAMDQDVQTTDAVTFATVNTGEGDNELFNMDQDVQSSDAVTFATVNTGQGAYELYAMDQDVQSSDSPTFNHLSLTTLFIANEPTECNINNSFMTAFAGNLSTCRELNQSIINTADINNDAGFLTEVPSYLNVTTVNATSKVWISTGCIYHNGSHLILDGDGSGC